MIKFEEVDYKSIKMSRKKEKVYRELFAEFLQSGKPCVKVTEHNCKTNATFLSNAMMAIKKYKIANVKLLYRAGEVYLVNILLQQGADGNEIV